MLKDKKNADARKEETRGHFKKLQIVAILTFAAMLIAIAATADGRISIETLTAKTHGDILRSAILLILLFGVKSLTIIVPLASLYIASGMLFSPPMAILINFIGLAAAFTCPYLLGRWSGTGEIAIIKEKYPKVNRIIRIQEKNEIFAVFIIRLIGWLPCDVLSFYFGACQVTFPFYLLASLAGSSIGLVTNTLLGDVILNPFSIEFAVLMLVKVLVSASAVGIAYFMNRGK